MATEEEELLLRQLPHSTEAEQAVLGSMLIAPRCVPEVIDKLRPDDFYLQQNRDIFGRSHRHGGCIRAGGLHLVHQIFLQKFQIGHVHHLTGK